MDLIAADSFLAFRLLRFWQLACGYHEGVDLLGEEDFSRVELGR